MIPQALVVSGNPTPDGRRNETGCRVRADTGMPEKTGRASKSRAKTGKTAVLQRPGIRKTVLYRFYIAKIHYLYVLIYAIKTRTCQITNTTFTYG